MGENKKLYLVEQIVGDHLQIVALVKKWDTADALMIDQQGIITEIEIGKVYYEGVSICNHWHYDEDGPEQNGPEEVAETIL